MASARPTLPATPLRRLSRGSYAAGSLARSTADDPSGLDALGSLLLELADGLDDTAADLEALDALNATLVSFNESFATFLLGLKMGAYTTEWPEQPHLANYALAARRAHQAAAAAARAVEAVEQRSQPAAEAAEMPEDGADGPDASFHSAIMTRGRVPVRATTRGRGRGGGMMQQRKREALVAFAGEIIATLPIKFREEQARWAHEAALISRSRIVARWSKSSACCGSTRTACAWAHFRRSDPRRTSRSSCAQLV